jgi:hypothetical protein
MDTTAASLLGDQLRDFLVKQFAPPPGTSTRLGFLGAGVAVDPNSFLSQDQFNPARVNSWLNIVIDPLGTLAKDGDPVGATPWTASVLMETISGQSVCVAPAGSVDQQGFARAKSLAIENLGGATSVNTAPLDWYDPAQVPKWSKCSLSTSSTSTTGTGPPPQPPPGNVPPRRPIWAWRTLAEVSVADPQRLQPVETPPTKAPATGVIGVSIQPQRFMLSTSMVTAASLTKTAQLAPVSASVGHPQLMQVSHVSDGARISIEKAPVAIINEKTTRQVTAVQAVMVSQAISTAAAQASTSSVKTNSLSLDLTYLVVSLSRAPWWSDLLPLLDNWYIPGLRRGSLTGDGDAQKVTGVPIALILTSDVKIRAIWSDADRAAASSNTHFGPWVLSSAQFTSTTNAGEAILTIPGVTAIACIYRELPALPPKADPSLPPAADLAGL